MSNQKIVVDCTKGTTSYVPLSAAELAEQDQMAAAAAEAQVQREADEAAKAAAKASAEAKLAELGLSADEIAAL